MTKVILLTGATDGIGFETAKKLAGEGHTLLLHGRSKEKLAKMKKELSEIAGVGLLETFQADLSVIPEVETLASTVAEKHSTLDVLINNAGVFKTANPQTADGYDIRFIVNTVAPFLLTKRLLAIMPLAGRVVNLSSAAQAPVSFDALNGKQSLSDSDAYAQSKLGITMWSFHLSQTLCSEGPATIAVNPASFLASKMVKEAYGSDGNDLGIGADILARAALSSEFENASGRYYDNDRRQFGQPHPDALDRSKNERLVRAIEDLIAILNR
ncbi:MAG: SDR family NAD(P)-dependent oxidoreductase [Burkholderiaceae bacterium]